MNRRTQKERTSDVLFQKLGNTWYAFTQVGTEVQFTALPKNINPRKVKFQIFSYQEDAEVTPVNYISLDEAC